MVTDNTKIIAEYLADAPVQFLQEVVDHGIHNLTNDFSGGDYDYDAIAEEFSAAAELKLADAD